ncbi:hypothetical protein BH20ACI2_BH20ACI2_05430 [soil metagenome]
MYTYCGNDPINHTDPSGLFFGKLFKWISKALKWIAVAVVIAVVIMSSPYAPALAGTLLAKILGVIISIGAKVGLAANFLAGGLLLAEGASAVVAASVGAGALFAARPVVGAIANAFAKNTNRSGSGRLKSGCDYLQSLYPRIKAFLDSLWKKTIDSKSKTYPTGREAGGYIWISNREVVAGVGEVFGNATYEGPTTDRSMGRAFDTWLRNQADRVPSGATVVIVHTHPRSTSRPSPGDINAAILTRQSLQKIASLYLPEMASSAYFRDRS